MRWRSVVAVTFILGATLAVYGGVGGYEFVSFDDDRYVFDNPVVLKGLSIEALRWAFTTTEMGSWHPLTWLSHLLVVSLFGARAGPQHLVNAGLHLLSALLLLRLMTAMTGALWPSALTAALWAVHPLHVESVAWIAERKDVLSGLLLLLTLIAWVRHLRGGARGWYGAALLLFALGLMAKPIVITLPALLLLLDYWPLGRIAAGAPRAARWRTALFEKLPFFALTLASAAITYASQKGAGALNPALFGQTARRASNAVLAAASYLGDLVRPSGLIPFYPLPATAPPMSAVASATLLLIVCTALALAASKRLPALTVGWLWYLTTLLPVIGLIQAGGQARADRYTYLPLLGIFMALSWAVAAYPPRAPVRAAGCAAAIAVIVVLTFQARTQAAHWRDTRALFTHTLQVDPDNWMAHLILGDDDLARGEIDPAGDHYRSALRAEPTLTRGHERLGTIDLDYLKRPADALEHYRRALSLEPRSAVLHHNAGLALTSLGRFDEAVSAFRRALELRPGYFLAHLNMGVALHRAGHLEAAAAAYRDALRVQPGDARAAGNLKLAQQALTSGRSLKSPTILLQERKEQ